MIDGGSSMTILECLKAHGQCLDREIAAELRLPLADVQDTLQTLAANGHVIVCRLTRFESGTPVQSLQCRLAGYVPPRAAGRKTS